MRANLPSLSGVLISRLLLVAMVCMVTSCAYFTWQWSKTATYTDSVKAQLAKDQAAATQKKELPALKAGERRRYGPEITVDQSTTTRTNPFN